MSVKRSEITLRCVSMHDVQLIVTYLCYLLDYTLSWFLNQPLPISKVLKAFFFKNVSPSEIIKIRDEQKWEVGWKVERWERNVILLFHFHLSVSFSFL